MPGVQADDPNIQFVVMVKIGQHQRAKDADSEIASRLQRTVSIAQENCDTPLNARRTRGRRSGGRNIRVRNDDVQVPIAIEISQH